MSASKIRAANRRTTPAVPAAAVVPLLLCSVAGCTADGVTEPLTELRIESVGPSPFRAGDEIVVRGTGVGHAKAYLNGVEAERLSARNGVLTIRAPSELPECGVPLPRVSLKLEAGSFGDSTSVLTYGSPAAVDLRVGEHAVVEAVGRGCDVLLPRAGTYGVAVYTTAENRVTELERMRRVTFTVNVRNAAPAASRAREDGQAIEGLPASARTAPAMPAVSEPAFRFDTSLDDTCVRPPAAVGDGLEIRDINTGEPFPTVVAAATPHFALLAEPDSLTSLRTTLLEEFADELERRVAPFLRQAFNGWPDADGDGRLNVVVGRIDGGLYAGGGLAVDGCTGDFIHMGWAYIDGDDERYRNPFGVVVHEATHWYDSGPNLARLNSVPDWSIEGYASLAARLWRYEDAGGGPWENAPPVCGPGCTFLLLEQNRYGWPGLSRPSGYGHGSHILMYLLQQVVSPGESLLAAFAAMRNRPGGSGLVALRPVFEAAGGAGRTEAQLQGEFLLAHYADDFIDGISEHLVLHEWDLSAHPSFSRYERRLDAADPHGTVELARPDGVLLEIVVGPGAVVTVTPARSDLAVALVRRD